MDTLRDIGLVRTFGNDQIALLNTVNGNPAVQQQEILVRLCPIIRQILNDLNTLLYLRRRRPLR